MITRRAQVALNLRLKPYRDQTPSPAQQSWARPPPLSWSGWWTCPGPRTADHGRGSHGSVCVHHRFMSWFHVKNYFSLPNLLTVFKVSRVFFLRTKAQSVPQMIKNYLFIYFLCCWSRIAIRLVKLKVCNYKMLNIPS